MTFNRFAHVLSQWAGHPKTFQAAILLFVVWGCSGPYFHYNDTWQLIINTSTTIITFLMVFLIQNTQTATTTRYISRLMSCYGQPRTRRTLFLTWIN